MNYDTILFNKYNKSMRLYAMRLRAGGKVKTRQPTDKNKMNVIFAFVLGNFKALAYSFKVDTIGFLAVCNKIFGIDSMDMFDFS